MSIEKLEVNKKTVSGTRNEYFSKNPIKDENGKVIDYSRNSPKGKEKKKEYFDMIKNDPKYNKYKRESEKKNKDRENYIGNTEQNLALEKAILEEDILNKIKINEGIGENKNQIEEGTKNYLIQNGITQEHIDIFKQRIPKDTNLNNIKIEELPGLIRQSQNITNNPYQAVENTLIQDNLNKKIKELINPKNETVNRKLIQTFNINSGNISQGGTDIQQKLEETYGEKINLINKKIVDKKKFYENIYILQESIKSCKSTEEIEKLKNIEGFKEYFDNFLEIIETFDNIGINLKESLGIDTYYINENLLSNKLKHLSTKSLESNGFYQKFLSEDILNIGKDIKLEGSEKDSKNKEINKEYIKYCFNCLKNTFDINTDNEGKDNMLNDLITGSDSLDFIDLDGIINHGYNIALKGKLNGKNVNVRYNIQTGEIFLKQYLSTDENNNDIIKIDSNSDINGKETYKKCDIIKLPSIKDFENNIDEEIIKEPKKYFSQKSEEYLNNPENKNNKIFFDKYIEESKTQESFINLLGNKSDLEISSSSHQETFQNYSYITKSIKNMNSEKLRRLQKNISDLEKVINKLKQGYEKNGVENTIAEAIYKQFKDTNKGQEEYKDNIFNILRECSIGNAKDSRFIGDINIDKLDSLIKELEKNPKDQKKVGEYGFINEIYEKGNIDETIENAY